MLIVGKKQVELNTRNDTQETEQLELFSKGPVIQNIELLFKNYDALKKENKENRTLLKGKVAGYTNKRFIEGVSKGASE